MRRCLVGGVSMHHDRMSLLKARPRCFRAGESRFPETEAQGSLQLG